MDDEVSSFKLSDEEFKKIFPFDEPREGQREVIEQILGYYNSGKKCVVLNAPTGVGKSAIGYAIARYFENGYILTSQKILQEQYYRDFSIPFVLGRANYTCQKKAALTCDSGPCRGIRKNFCTTGGAVSCPYIVARENCLSSPYSNINYSYFLQMFPMAKAGSQFQRKLIVCDEAHNLEAELLNRSVVSISKDSLAKMDLDIDLPDPLLSDAEKKNWLFGEFYRYIAKAFDNVKIAMTALDRMPNTPELKRMSAKRNALGNLSSNMELMKAMNDIGQPVIITQDDYSIEFKMLFCNELFKKMLMPYGEKILLMSATILDYKTYIKNLGLDETECAYIECDSSFPVENRLIHFVAVGSMSMKNKADTLPKMCKAVDQILRENPDVKGIIHTVSYDVAEKIITELRYSPMSSRLLLPRRTNKKAILDAFQNSEKPYVLISPSLTEGVDLKDDLSRLCIICKVPYGNLKDKWTKTKLEKDRAWYIANACTTLVQMTGRSIRSETDFATTYILDSDFLKLAQSAIDIFPKWWKDAVVID